MDQVGTLERSDVNPGHDGERPLVFLDSSVLIGYLRGEASAAPLFSAEAAGLIRLAINAIVMQDLLLAGDPVHRPEFEQIRDRLEVLPIDVAKAEALVERARRTRFTHSNDLLVLSSAGECDFLVTQDPLMKGLVTTDKPQVLTPEEFVTHLRAA